MDVFMLDLRKKFYRPKKSSKKSSTVSKSHEKVDTCWLNQERIVDPILSCRGEKRSKVPSRFSMLTIFHKKMTKAVHTEPSSLPDRTKTIELIPCNDGEETNNSSVLDLLPDTLPTEIPKEIQSKIIIPDVCDNGKNPENVLDIVDRCNHYKAGFEGSVRARYHWSLVRQFIRCTFAIRDARRKPWVQLVGHADSFQTGEVGTVLKKLCKEELVCMELLMKDVVKPFVPLFLGVRNVNGEEHIEMRDLLTGFDSSASVMDCKIGVRTYLEDELVKAKKDPKLRADMYQKMIQVDPSEPTPEEHAAKAVTKPRYMQWRETLSSSATLGFRIEGVRKSNGFSSKDFKDKRRRDEVISLLKNFTECSPQITEMYLHRLRQLNRIIEHSDFFATHEVIGSSLLLIHDSSGLAGVWMIDFAKTIPLPPDVHTDHIRPWVEGNHEEGYLLGLRNLISCFEHILFEIRHS